MSRKVGTMEVNSQSRRKSRLLCGSLFLLGTRVSPASGSPLGRAMQTTVAGHGGISGPVFLNIQVTSAQGQDNFNLSLKTDEARRWWLTPLMPAEAEGSKGRRNLMSSRLA